MVLGDFPLWIVFLALIADAMIGDPDWIWRRLPHPVVWFGGFISWFEARLNDHVFQSPALGRFLGGVSTSLLLAGAWIVGAFVEGVLLTFGVLGGITLAVFASFLLAQRSLYDHVAEVSKPLLRGDVAGARKAVSMIVGRDPDQLDESGIARAAI